MAIVSKSVQQIIEKGISEVFIDEYSKFKWKDPYTGYRLEQCGKRWRVMHYILGQKDPKTDWMTYEEAEALRKLFEAST